MKRAATRALLLCLVALILSTLLWAGAPAAAVNTYESKILETFGGDIVAYWPLDETEGSTAYDVSGNDRHGTYNGVTLDQVDGAGATMGRAGFWDGINDYINIDTAAQFSADLPITIALWAASESTGDHYLFDLGAPRRALAQWGDWYLYNGGTTAPAVARVTGWHSWIAIFDVTGCDYYLDGVWVAGNSVPSQAGAMSIGRIGSNWGTHEMWYGPIQHAVIINTAATEDGIAILADPEALPEATPTPTPLPLSHYMTLESGQPVRLDYSATAGDMLIGTLLLVFVGLLAFLVYLGLAKR